jgi:hypothetical protein
MGGTTSKLDENDWNLADGKLQDNEHTIDGAPAMSHYKVYYMNKKSVNQREFDVVDDNMNLVFTTRSVPGTIACFDILGPGLDSSIVRVNADITRRYWIVYRFRVPTFQGQLPDTEATEKLRFEQTDEDGTLMVPEIVPLYKRCCITAQYGPPSVAMMLAQSKADGIEEVDDSEEEYFEGAASEIADRMKERGATELLNKATVADDNSKPTDQTEMESSIGSTTTQDANEIRTGPEVPRQNSALEPGNPVDSTSDFQSEHPSPQDTLTSSEIVSENPTIRISASMPELHGATYTGALDRSDDEIPSSYSTVSTSTTTPTASMVAATSVAHMKHWIQQQSQTIMVTSQSIRDKSLAAYETYKAGPHKTGTSSDLLQGVIQLEKPLLLCQEVYNRIFGNHQTSLVSKEQVIELLQRDMAQHVKEHPEDADQNADPFVTVQEVLAQAGERSPKNEMFVGTTGKNESGLEKERSPRIETGEEFKEVDVGEPIEKEQPLVGYWIWEHTLRSHKIKLHVAKGTDLALHVVLAIIANQVRFERHALTIAI